MTNPASHASILADHAPSPRDRPVPAWLAIEHHWAWLTACARRHAERARLAQLDERAWADLGRHRVHNELAKPFWRD